MLRIGSSQRDDPKLREIFEQVEGGTKSSNLDRYSVDREGWLRKDGRLYVPDIDELILEVLRECHRSRMTIHPGGDKMYRDMKRIFYWPKMKRHVSEFVAKCMTCQLVKAEQKKPSGLLLPLDVPQWKWESISMDFVDGLPRSRRGNESIWVIVDRLTKSAHFIPIKASRTAMALASLYVKEVVRLHGIPKSIVSDRDPLFTSRFWQSMQSVLGTELSLSTAYHPQTDGQTERVNRVLEDLLRACVIDFGGSWEDHLPLVEFTYNNSFQSSIGMAPFEALYGRPCKSPSCWLETTDRLILGPDMIRETSEMVDLIRKRMKASQDRQKSYADRRRVDLEFSVGDLVFVKISPLKRVVRFGKAGKLTPRFVGPFRVLERIGPLAYRVDLPDKMAGVHNVFHVSHLRKCVHDEGVVIQPNLLEDVDVQPELARRKGLIRIVDHSTRQLKNKTVKLVRVQWSEREGDSTWESEDRIRASHPELFTGMFASILNVFFFFHAC